MAGMVLLVGACSGSGGAAGGGTVLFVGDSNLSLNRGRVMAAASADGFEPFVAARLGFGIRTDDYWRTRLAEVAGKIDPPEAVVVNLGINDALLPGTAEGQGFVDYGRKLDWLMGLLGEQSVYWTNLPCAIEPPAFRPGCVEIDRALASAPARWTNLTVLDWASEANGHPEWMLTPGVEIHYSRAGQEAWTAFVLAAL